MLVLNTNQLIKPKIFILQVPGDQPAKNIAENPDVRKLEIIITPVDKEDSSKPIKLQLSIKACFELGKNDRT